MRCCTPRSTHSALLRHLHGYQQPASHYISLESVASQYVCTNPLLHTSQFTLNLDLPRPWKSVDHQPTQLPFTRSLLLNSYAPTRSYIYRSVRSSLFCNVHGYQQTISQCNSLSKRHHFSTSMERSIAIQRVLNTVRYLLLRQHIFAL